MTAEKAARIPDVGWWRARKPNRQPQSQPEKPAIDPDEAYAMGPPFLPEQIPTTLPEEDFTAMGPAYVPEQPQTEPALSQEEVIRITRLMNARQNKQSFEAVYVNHLVNSELVPEVHVEPIPLARVNLDKANKKGETTTYHAYLREDSRNIRREGEVTYQQDSFVVLNEVRALLDKHLNIKTDKPVFSLRNEVTGQVEDIQVQAVRRNKGMFVGRKLQEATADGKQESAVESLVWEVNDQLDLVIKFLKESGWKGQFIIGLVAKQSEDCFQLIFTFNEVKGGIFNLGTQKIKPEPLTLPIILEYRPPYSQSHSREVTVFGNGVVKKINAEPEEVAAPLVEPQSVAEVRRIVPEVPLAQRSSSEILKLALQTDPTIKAEIIKKRFSLESDEGGFILPRWESELKLVQVGKESLHRRFNLMFDKLENIFVAAGFENHMAVVKARAEMRKIIEYYASDSRLVDTIAHKFFGIEKQDERAPRRVTGADLQRQLMIVDVLQANKSKEALQWLDQLVFADYQMLIGENQEKALAAPMTTGEQNGLWYGFFEKFAVDLQHLMDKEIDDEGFEEQLAELEESLPGEILPIDVKMYLKKIVAQIKAEAEAESVDKTRSLSGLWKAIRSGLKGSAVEQPTEATGTRFEVPPELQEVNQLILEMFISLAGITKDSSQAEIVRGLQSLQELTEAENKYRELEQLDGATAKATEALIQIVKVLKDKKPDSRLEQFWFNNFYKSIKKADLAGAIKEFKNLDEDDIALLVGLVESSEDEVLIKSAQGWFERYEKYNEKYNVPLTPYMLMAAVREGVISEADAEALKYERFRRGDKIAKLTQKIREATFQHDLKKLKAQIDKKEEAQAILATTLQGQGYSDLSILSIIQTLNIAQVNLAKNVTFLLDQRLLNSDFNPDSVAGYVETIEQDLDEAEVKKLAWNKPIPLSGEMQPWQVELLKDLTKEVKPAALRT